MGKRWQEHANPHGDLFVRSPDARLRNERRREKEARAQAQRVAEAERWIKSLRIGRALRGKR